jgi:hypothetical protein
VLAVSRASASSPTESRVSFMLKGPFIIKLILGGRQRGRKGGRKGGREAEREEGRKGNDGRERKGEKGE